MSEHVSKKDFDSLKSTAVFSLKNVFFIMVPASVGLVVLSDDIIRALFQRGSFDAYSTAITSLALLFYAIGLLFYSGSKILVSCFYSLKDTRTPVKVAFVCLLINITLNTILMFPLKVGGLALASSISAMVNFVLLFKILHRQIKFDLKQVPGYGLRIFLCGLAMFLALSCSKMFLAAVVSNGILRLGILILIGAISYFAASLMLKIEQARSISWIVFRRSAA
jgi:putative peptidoglycan lipid II flippase